MTEQPLRAPGLTLSNEMLRDVALEAAQAAARVIRDAAPRAAGLVWKEKQVSDFVSEVDLAAEASALHVIRRRVPDAGVLAEESATTIETEQLERAIVFVVDPLDGTTNFLHGYPEYAVSVGVLRDGGLVAGVVIDIPLNEEFSATAGAGAFRNGERLQVSSIEDPTRALFGTGIPFKRGDDATQYLAQLGRVMASAAGVRRAGAAALDLASVACGRFEGFWELRLAPWDIAAGLLLVREAGGVATTLDGRECGVEHTGLVAGSPRMHRWLLDTLAHEPAR